MSHLFSWIGRAGSTAQKHRAGPPSFPARIPVNLEFVETAGRGGAAPCDTAATVAAAQKFAPPAIEAKWHGQLLIELWASYAPRVPDAPPARGLAHRDQRLRTHDERRDVYRRPIAGRGRNEAEPPGGSPLR